MVDFTNPSSSKISSDQEHQEAVIPKDEILDFDFPSQTAFPTHFGENVASSSGSNARSSLIGMGFRPSLVDEVILEKGEDDVELLLDTLFAYSDPQKANSASSDSLDSLFGDKVVSSPPEVSTFFQPKEEPDLPIGVAEEKTASLLMMKFSVDEVKFAMNKLGPDTPIDEIVDFIAAAQIAEKFDEENDDTDHQREEKNEDLNNETLFGTMDKTLYLLEMGFSETEVSWAIEKFGPGVPISELADSIFSGQSADGCFREDKPMITTGANGLFTTINDRTSALARNPALGSTRVKTEASSSYAISQQMNANVDRGLVGKRPKQEQLDGCFDTVPQFRRTEYNESHRGKRPKQEYDDDFSTFLGPTWHEEKVDHDFTNQAMPNPSPRRILNGVVAKSPYFLYANLGNLSHDSWVKISKFLYNLEPEFVNTHFFSALSRKEGYIHNLPTEDRFHILPKPPMTIQEAIPDTKKWWPDWDSRKQLNCISSEVNGVSMLCDRLRNTLANSNGMLPFEQQRNMLHQCRSLNLMWVGHNKLGPISPECLESILGYPSNHTQAYSSLMERFQSLKYCFQTDTLGYHLSVLKAMYPEGLTVLSIFSGIGGAEIALHRLGIRLKSVVSVETSETKRRVLKNWWQRTGQRGELMQVQDIQRLTSSRLSSMFDKFGGFDFVICQNPCTQSSGSKAAIDGDTITGFDFSLFCEYVRILQCVRTVLDKKR
ncbi:probable inactive DNA (cytosine-5)-methyltransferase DRM3 [Humulus lupulus]|uniref:probable inactive DNA (cytosine-5)-methyltransferase DRM3 n=1 Tax=Humulus lupulus TaxID=3486 RepID=UPI002B415794|nr:probable inactive DNA (cytosine-5)-methyltransferase DRM3 [Humulus lupulus]